MTKRAQRLSGSARLGPCLHCLHFLHHDLLRIHRIFFRIRISFLWFRHLRHLVVHFPEPRSHTTAIEAGSQVICQASDSLALPVFGFHLVNLTRSIFPGSTNRCQHGTNGQTNEACACHAQAQLLAKSLPAVGLLHLNAFDGTSACSVDFSPSSKSKDISTSKTS